MEIKKTYKRKLEASALAVTLAAVLGLSGTLAWQSVSQTAKNEAAELANPGGRLHDDFNGTTMDKDIYVENFTSPDDGGQPIFARVQLREYMELGDGAGLKTGEGMASKKAKSVIEGKTIDNPAEWSIYIPGEQSLLRTYIDLKQDQDTDKYYMPTFNKNKDSILADIRGSINDVNDQGEEDPYCKYKKWADAETEAGSEIYDADLNAVDEYGDGTNPDAYKVKGADGVDDKDANVEIKKDQTHTTKKLNYTDTATVITMADWLVKDDAAKKGPYWVVDTDGWAYWAQPIQPGETTGLLLNGLETKSLSGNYYYGLQATAQFCTSDDWGVTEHTGFFSTENGNTAPSDNAQKLLAAAAGQTSLNAPGDADNTDNTGDPNQNPDGN